MVDLALPTSLAAPTSVTLTPAEIVETRAASLNRLSILLRLAEGAWALAVYEDPSIRQQMIDALQTAIAPVPVLSVSMHDRVPDLVAVLHQLPKQEPAAAVMVHTIGSQLVELGRRIDIQRESLARYPQRLVVWVTDHEERTLVRVAPNFVSRLSGVYYFPGTTRVVASSAQSSSQTARLLPGDLTWLSARHRPRMSVRDEQQRAQLITYGQQRIHDLLALPRPNFETIGDAWYDLAGLFEDGTPRRWPEAEAAYAEAARYYQHAGCSLAEAEARFRAGAAALRSYQSGPALEHLKQALHVYRLLEDTPVHTPDAIDGEANVLKAQGDVLSFLKQTTDALAKYEAALGLFRAVGAKSGEASTLNNIGSVYSALGEKAQALAYYEQSLPLSRQVGDKSGEATALNNIGGVYSALGEKAQALACYEQALPLRRQVGDKSGEATTLNSIGAVYSALGEKAQALACYEQALPLFRQVGNKAGEASTLNNIGLVYSDLGEKAQALACYEQALPLFRQVGNKAGEASTLNNIGLVYSDLGEKAQAQAYFEQALPLKRQVGDKSGEATTLNNIGGVYSDLGEKAQAQAYFEQALPLFRQVGDKSGEASTLNNIGSVYDDLGEKAQALAYYEQALPLRRQVGDKSGEATTLSNIGLVYSDLGEKAQALAYYEQSLPLSRQVGDRWGEAVTRYNIAMVAAGLGDLARSEAELEAVVAIDEAAAGPQTWKTIAPPWRRFEPGAVDSGLTCVSPTSIAPIGREDRNTSCPVP